MKFALVLISMISGAAFAAQESKEFESNGINTVLVENTSGNVSISATDANKAAVVATKNRFSDQCKMTVDRSGHKLVIKVEKVSRFFNTEECNVDFQVKVPQSTNLDLTIGSGDLLIKGVQGTLNFKMGSGNISADGNFQKAEGKSGSGKIVLKGLSGGGNIMSGSGDIDLMYASGALKGELDLKTGSGDAIVLFPKGTQVKTSFTAGVGELSNELGDNPRAKFKVSMKAGSGNLKIKSY